MSSIRPIRVSRQVEYGNDQVLQYKEYCDHYGEVTTQRGFEIWCKDYMEDDFGVPVSHLDVKVIQSVGFITC